MINTFMKVDDILETDVDIAEWKASKELCKSSKSNSAIGSSALASCKSQGFRSREGNKSHLIGKKRKKMGGTKTKGAKYGGPIPRNRGE